MVELANTLIASPAPALPSAFRGKSIEIPKNPLFSSLSRQQTRLIQPHIKHKKFRSGRTILEEGAKNPGKIYIVIEGQVALTKQGISPIEGQPVGYEIAAVRRGDIFGEVSFVDGKPSSVSFVAATDVTLAIVDLSAWRRKGRVRRVRAIVTRKLRRHIAHRAGESATLRMNSLQIENELAAYRSGVGHIVVTALCLLSFYTLAASLLPRFKSIAHANFAITPLIIFLFAFTFVPIMATSGFPARFFGLQLVNWKSALALSCRASALFLLALMLTKWLLIETLPSFAGLSLFGNADIEVDGHSVSFESWYWLALFVYIFLTPMQEFVARSAIQAPLYAFLHGSERKRRWCSILAANLVFTAAHAHISLAFAIAAFIPGILWGWIFAKTNSLFAATMSHILVGSAAIYLFGIEAVVSKISL
ncbi:MAG TPA: cyclic nucleotide-binding domain-containing protein [Hyphomicrobiales bacterium]|nr:cyclic nucleotide-binding domain-containing protein [Hyphomicrobiales bacterium]